MSNEDLVKRIQDGEAEAVIELWENVRRFIHLQAYRYHVFSGGLYEIEDLEQAGFIAMIQAANKYRPGESSFINYLSLRLKNEFALTYNGTRGRDPLLVAKRLDDYINDDGDTLADITPDPGDQYEEAERKIYLEQLQQQLNKALSELPENQKKIILSRYYNGLTLNETAEELNASVNETRSKERKALDKLRKNKELERFIDLNTPFYMKLSIDYIISNHESSVEKLVLKREQLRKKYNGAPLPGADESEPN